MSKTGGKPNPYLKARQANVRVAMDELEVDSLLLTTTSDITYLTGFTGDDSIGILTPDDFVLVTDFRYKEQAEIESPWLKTEMREGKMSEALAGAILKLPIKQVGFDANTTTFGQVRGFKKELRKQAKGKKVDLKPVEDVLVNIRKIKDDSEIAIIRQSITAAQTAYQAIRRRIKPGLSENELAGQLFMELRNAGASNSSFPSIIAAGANSSLPHYRPGQTKVRWNQPLLIDWGAIFKGYCSDLTRTLILGKVSSEMKKIYQIVLEAQQAAIAALRPGMTTKEADTVARDIIDAAGYKDQFGHGLGHGIGLDIHELPAMRRTGFEDVLKPGMVVTVEPGIYLPGKGGVRIEDDVLITPDGCEVLSSLDKSLQGCSLE